MPINGLAIMQLNDKSGALPNHLHMPVSRRQVNMAGCHGLTVFWNAGCHFSDKINMPDKRFTECCG